MYDDIEEGTSTVVDGHDVSFIPSHLAQPRLAGRPSASLPGIVLVQQCWYSRWKQLQLTVNMRFSGARECLRQLTGNRSVRRLHIHPRN